MNARTRIVLRHKWALGDSVLLTALCRDLQLTYPGAYEILIDCHFRDTFNNNPHARVLQAHEKAAAKVYDVNYAEGIRAAGRGQRVHMLSWYHTDLARKLNLKLQPLKPHGDIHLAGEELISPLPGQRYWVVMAGYKLDITLKAWWQDRYQQVVDALSKQGITVVQAGALHREHRQPKLTGVIDMVGRCPASRDFFRLIAHSEGVISPVTAAMHIAASFKKPCVVISGGREEPWWEHYTNDYQAFGQTCEPVAVPHRFLHTIGQLPCCQTKGCWKHRAIATGLQDQWEVPDKRCKLPILKDSEAIGQCMDMITAEQVVDAVMSYYKDGTLLPLSGRTITAGEKLLQLPGFDNTPRPVMSLQPLVTPAMLPAIRRFGESEIQNPVSKSPPEPSMIDHPTIGGRLTVCVLCFGDHPDLARRCIGSIIDTIPAGRLDLRVGLNAASEETRAYVKSLPQVRFVYDSPENIRKYPMMRKMFHDPDMPIRTPYMVWFDDDTKVVAANMWSQLCETIVANHPQGCRLYGWPMIHDTSAYAKGGHDPTQWFKTATWWRGKGLYTRGRPIEAPNGSVLRFVPGWFWAIASETIRTADIPDKRLNHNGGDITIGTQVQQVGGKIKSFNIDKALVWTPKKEQGGRRGFSENFPWSQRLPVAV